MPPSSGRAESTRATRRPASSTWTCARARRSPPSGCSAWTAGDSVARSPAIAISLPSTPTTSASHGVSAPVAGGRVAGRAVAPGERRLGELDVRALVALGVDRARRPGSARLIAPGCKPMDVGGPGEQEGQRSASRLAVVAPLASVPASVTVVCPRARPDAVLVARSPIRSRDQERNVSVARHQNANAGIGSVAATAAAAQRVAAGRADARAPG